MTKHSLPNDFLGRKVIQSLLILQLIAILPVAVLSFTRYASIALFIAFLLFLILVSVFAWLYSRYQAGAIVKQKRRLQQEIGGLKTKIQTEDTHINKARQARDQLSHSEKLEIAATLKNLQEAYIRNGLANSLIADANIPGIGPKLKERLVAHGIRSAADVNLNVMTKIEGFGTAKNQAVLGWRRVVDSQLEQTKPLTLPLEQENEIKQKFQVRHTENDASEQKAKDKKVSLETELHNLLPALDPFIDITFRNYISGLLAKQAWAAGVIATILITSQICMGASATAGTIALSAPATPTQAVDLVSFQTVVAQTVIANITQSAPTFTLSPAPTSTIAFTATPTGDASLFSTSIPSLSSDNLLRFHLIDVGQGDGILIQTPDGKTILVDGGEGNSDTVQYLQGLGIKTIDLIVATHPHDDHIGGLVQVLATFPVQRVITNGQSHTTNTYERFLDGIASAKAEYIEVKRGDVFSVGNINFLVLNPTGNFSSDLNENSVVLQFTYGQTTFLLMGDSGAETEQSLLSSGLPLKANILKVGHHGSASASTPAFLNAVNPDVALYSAGINNQYHHPAPQTISALEAVGAMIYGTDKQGTIVVSVDLNRYTIETAKGITTASNITPTIGATSQPTTSGEFSIVSVTSPVSAGGNATLTAKASPGASCTITVYYKSGPSKAQGLDPKSANANGEVSWTWKVGSRTAPGNWPIDVSCNGVLKGTTITVQ